MFAGLAVEGSSDESSDGEPEPAAAAPPCTPVHSVLGGIDDQDLEITIETLNAVAADLTLFRSLPFKALRQAIGPLAEELLGGGGGRRRGNPKKGGGGGTRLDGLDPEERLRQMDRDALNHRVLRAERLARLDQLALEGADEGGPRLLGGPSTDVARLDDRAAAAPAAVARLPDGPAATAGGEALPEAPAATLHFAQSCYVCKAPYRELHAFYASLCPPCAELNWRKREERCDLRGRVALVTGGRMKIGFRIVLKLLRCGATVVATTRFPTDAARRFSGEADAADWAERLHVVGADFRDLTGLEALCDALPSLVPRLDVVVNNACQTVRRPPQYYLPLVAAEVPRESDPPAVVRLTAAHRTVAAAVAATAAAAGGAEPAAIVDSAAGAAGGSEGGEAGGGEAGGAPAALMPTAQRSPAGAAGEAIVPGMSMSLGGAAGAGASAVMAMLPVAPGDATRDDAAFPRGATDGNCDLGQQLDLRGRNSWTLKLEEVSTAEMAEVLAINSLAPSIINGRLKAFMQATADGGVLKFIVNVSAMEGRFYKYKQPTHPHTNMAKAALNMMTRTSAADYAKCGIYMTAVDTGWINDEKPAERAAADHSVHNFQTPIDEIDAAARVLDPIIAPLRRQQAGEEPKPPFGVFLKDYERCEW